MQHTDIESAIDDVARGMTSGKVPALRAAVMQRLPARRPVAWRVWLPVAASLSACVVAVGVYRSMRVQAPSAPAASVAANVARQPARSTAVETPSVAKKATRRAVRAPSTPLVNTVDATPGLPALPDIAMLSVSEIQPNALVIPQLTVAPLTVAPIVVAPIGQIDR